MDEGCFNTSKFLRKIKHQRVNIFKSFFLVALSLDDRRGNHMGTLIYTKG